MASFIPSALRQSAYMHLHTYVYIIYTYMHAFRVWRRTATLCLYRCVHLIRYFKWLIIAWVAQVHCKTYRLTWNFFTALKYILYFNGITNGCKNLTKNKNIYNHTSRKKPGVILTKSQKEQEEEEYIAYLCKYVLRVYTVWKEI